MFDSPEKLALGLITGLIFGFLLQKGKAAKYHVILGQFLLKDWTVVKIMGSAVLVGAVGVYALVEMGAASLHVKPFLLGGVILGGLLFGVGMTIFGYCPGTSVAACAEGRRDAMVGVLGMITGAALFVGLYTWVEPVMKGLGDLGELTVPEVLDLSPWPVIAALVVVGGAGLAILARMPASRTDSWSWRRDHHHPSASA